MSDPRADEKALGEYHRKRDFDKTPEPRGGAPHGEGRGLLFVVQKHAARRLHYDFRLEMDGVLKSWAVPKGPCLDPSRKPLAVHTEDHPMAYARFEGIIPAGEYGGGTVMLWDEGWWEPIGDAKRGYAAGDLKFVLHGHKLAGAWVLARMSGAAADDGKNWLLIKKADDAARPIESYNILGEQPLSVASGRTLDEIASAPEAVWKDGAREPLANASSTSPAAPPSASSTRRRPRPDGVADPMGLAEAVAAPIPASIAPQLATLSKVVPDTDDWLHEIKLDGYRLMARVTDDGVTLFTRNGHDWTDRFPGVAEALQRLPLSGTFLDGEVVVLNEAGISDFHALQSAIRSRGRAAFTFFVFDVPYAEGADLRRVPLRERTRWLAALMASAPDAAPVIQYCDHIAGRGPLVFEQAAAAGLEGIISKRADAGYESRRSDSWLKIKCVKRQEFVVGGFTNPSHAEPGRANGIGALAVGLHDDHGRLVYCGRVGTGFRGADLEALEAIVAELATDTCPFVDPGSDAEARRTHWIEPTLVIEVEFGSWTKTGMLRHPSYRGIRHDRVARSVRREEPSPAPAPRGHAMHVVRTPRSPDDAYLDGVRISHPARTVYPEAGVTKLEVAEYYARIASRMIPHAGARPLSVVRCPLGLAGDAFFQRRLGEGFPESLKAFVYPGRDDETDDAILVHDATGLIALVQMGVLEVHAWGCRADRPDRPDQVVFDLDPGPGIEWEHVVESARVIRDFLDDLGLSSFVKTTGGHGLHLVVPITRRVDWDGVATFSRSVARALARMAPLNFVDTVTKSLRENRIYIDFLRNIRGATAVAAYSTRAREGATVSTPLAWSELSADVPPSTFTVRTVPDRLEQPDPWAGFDESRTTLTKAMKRLAP